jgi:hypothetical protein
MWLKGLAALLLELKLDFIILGQLIISQCFRLDCVTDHCALTKPVNVQSPWNSGARGHKPVRSGMKLLCLSVGGQIPKSGARNPCWASMCVMSIILWNVTPCGPIDHLCLGATFYFHRYGWREIQASIKTYVASKLACKQFVYLTSQWTTAELYGVTSLKILFIFTDGTISCLLRMWCLHIVTI